METRYRKGISTPVIAVIIIVVIIALAGWTAYFAYPISNITTKSQVITQSVTQTVTQTGGTSPTPVFLQPTVSNVSFTVVGFASVSQFADWFVAQQQGLFKKYTPNGAFTTLQTGGTIVQALVSGQAQMAFGGHFPHNREYS